MMPHASASASASSNVGGNATNGMTIPIQQQQHHHQQHQQQHPQQQQQQYTQQHPQQQQQQYHTPQQQYVDPSAQGYGSPSNSRQFPAHFQQDFGFDHDMDDMFSRRGMGRMHAPFSDFASRKRCGNDPHATASANDGFSHYFDDPDFGFSQFGTLGRRRAAAAAAAAAAASGAPHEAHPSMTHDDDFFQRLPSEFRQYIPDGFGVRRPTASAQNVPQSQVYYQQPPSNTPPTGAPAANGAYGPQSPVKKVCDAAIQTEDPSGATAAAGHSQVDGHLQPDQHLSQHGLRNTVDMGVKSMQDGDGPGARSHSAPPPEQLQQQQQQQMNGKRPTPPPPSQYGTQTSPQPMGAQQQPPQFQRVYYPPQQQAHPQQKQTTPPPPQTPGGTYVRTIPIFVEGRSEPIINAHKEIPNQYAAPGTANASASAKSYMPPQQQQYQQQPPQQQQRPTPLNTQATQEVDPSSGNALPPQTPHTLNSINKIQDIQRDVLDLMTKVEQFGGTRKDKEYAYLDEMLTRNLLKLDTIDTNGKDSIRLARKEAIKCIQASINVLEAKAEENARMAGGAAQAESNEQETSADVTKDAADEDAAQVAVAEEDEAQPADATKMQEPIPLPPPEGMQAAAVAAVAEETAASAENVAPAATETSVSESESKTE